MGETITALTPELTPENLYQEASGIVDQKILTTLQSTMGKSPVQYRADRRAYGGAHLQRLNERFIERTRSREGP